MKMATNDPVVRALIRTIEMLCDTPEMKMLADRYLAKAIIQEQYEEKHRKTNAQYEIDEEIPLNLKELGYDD